MPLIQIPIPPAPDGAPYVGVDLSSDRVILTSKVLDPWALPQDGCYLEVIAGVSRTTIRGKPSFFIAPTDTDKEFRVMPFDDIASDEATQKAEEEARPVALPALSTQGKRGVDEASVDATSGPSNLNTGAIPDDATSTASNKGNSNEPDFFYDELYPAACAYLLARPATFNGAKEVYIVRVPYVALKDL
ncbi:hypothetical protein FOMPIDRAFT_91985 [Fomitopsis schrenkii]|uniref:Uncharacterized protein n=1 Tax=Fomitopsis schrenkii TaxID=2126942 RepID=S8ETR7_FOMSC|nr:hypothetical protein FOMPIDRAFT_91985 [Fomitopsis schrenkii]